jgi:hypothetical protein
MTQNDFFVNSLLLAASKWSTLKFFNELDPLCPAKLWCLNCALLAQGHVLQVYVWGTLRHM